VVHASRSRPVGRWQVSVHTRHGQMLLLPVIGKAFNKGGGARAGRLLADLRAAGFDDAAFQVPRPLGWDPARRLLAQEEAPPGSLHALLDDGLLDEVGPPRRAGQWLARLHAVTRLRLTPLPESFEAHKLTEYGAALMARLPDTAHRLTALVQATAARLEEVAQPIVPTHGDFQPKNVYLDDRRVMVIDFDRAAMAPAARDLGHFVGQTRTMAAARHGGLNAADRWVESFLGGYLEGGGSAEALGAAPAYVARTFAEVLYYRLVVRPVRRTDFVPDWLDAWEGCLSGEEPGP
jgi:hypothetical protein